LKLSISLNELKHSIWIIFILTLVFGFNDGMETFVLSSWIYNLFTIFILVSISIFANIISAKITAMHFGEEAQLRILGINKGFNLLGYKIKSIPLAPIIALILIIASRGVIYFTSIFTIEVSKKSSFGKALHESKEALIYFWALIANLSLIIIFYYLNIESGVMINTWILIWNILPIPGFIGSRIFFNNKTLYAFFLVFAVLLMIFLGKMNTILLLVLSLLIGFLVMVWWLFKKEYKG